MMTNRFINSDCRHSLTLTFPTVLWGKQTGHARVSVLRARLYVYDEKMREGGRAGISDFLRKEKMKQQEVKLCGASPS